MGRQGLALAEAHDLADVKLAAMVEKGSALMLDLDAMGEGRELLEAAADEAERPASTCWPPALNNLIWHARQWSDIEEVRRLIDRMHRAAEAAGFEMLARVDEPVAQASWRRWRATSTARSPTWTR